MKIIVSVFVSVISVLTFVHPSFAQTSQGSTWSAIKSLYAAEGTANTVDLSAADELSAGRMSTILAPMATPPTFSGWSVVSGAYTVIFGPIWDQDWKIYFYLPNRSSLPRNRVVAAKNLRGEWLTYTPYAMLYGQGVSGSYYRVVYVFGGYRANVFGINMFDASNWALYYHD